MTRDSITKSTLSLKELSTSNPSTCRESIEWMNEAFTVFRRRNPLLSFPASEVCFAFKCTRKIHPTKSLARRLQDAFQSSDFSHFPSSFDARVSCSRAFCECHVRLGAERSRKRGGSEKISRRFLIQRSDERSKCGQSQKCCAKLVCRPSITVAEVNFSGIIKHSTVAQLVSLVLRQRPSEKNMRQQFRCNYALEKCGSI